MYSLICHIARKELCTYYYIAVNGPIYHSLLFDRVINNETSSKYKAFSLPNIKDILEYIVYIQVYQFRLSKITARLHFLYTITRLDADRTMIHTCKFSEDC